MVLDELEKKRRNSQNFQIAQRVVALLEGLEVDDVEDTLKLVNEIQQSEEQRNIAIVSYRQK